MATFIGQQVLKYDEHKDELQVLGQVVDLLRLKDVPGAIAVLLARQDLLQQAQRPRLAQYDQFIAGVSA